MAAAAPDYTNVIPAQFPESLQFLFLPARYKVPYGGRGSAKSWGVARALLLKACESKILILCARELQNSISESVHRLLSDQIEAMALTPWFEVTNNSIRCTNGSEFVFAGLRNNVTKIKSMEGIDICWVEEAEKVSNRSWEILIPTVRKDGSEIWITFNPDEETDPTYVRFVTNADELESCVSRLINWRDNPWFPEELRKEKDYLARVDVEAYNHVWEGQTNTRSNAVIFKGKYSVQDFKPVTDRAHDEYNWNGPYFGADWGFAADPTVLTKLWIFQRRLYVEKVSWGLAVPIVTCTEPGKEAEGIGDKWKREIPECADGYVIRADNSRPETINHLCVNDGLNVESARKWEGSVEDGIEFLRSFEEIVIHPSCEQHIIEARTYKYKVDKLTGDVLPIVLDKNNHCWDADRYALEPLISNSGSIYDNL